MKKIITLFLIASVCFTYAQNDIGSNTITDGFKMKSGSLKGTPYLLTEWVPGYAVDLNGKLSEQKLLNYNIYENVLTFKTIDGSDNIMAVNADGYSGFILTDTNKKDYLFTKVEANQFTKAKKHTKFYQIIVPPSKNVLLETAKILNDPNKSGWTSAQNTTKRASYESKNTYYVLAKDDKYTKISLSNSSVLKAFKDKKKEISAYLKSNNLKIKTAADVDQVANFYHSL